jgi:hypothetical protein
VGEYLSGDAATLLERFFDGYGVYAGDRGGPVGEFSTVVITADEAVELLDLLGEGISVDPKALAGRYLATRTASGFSAQRFDTPGELDAASARCVAAHDAWASSARED